MFENKIYEGIYYSQFVASWFKSGGIKKAMFKEWLMSLIINDKKIPDEIIREIVNFADNGKLELEESAKKFVNADIEKRMIFIGNLKAQQKLIEQSQIYAKRAVKKRDRGFDYDLELKMSKELMLIVSDLGKDLLDADL